MSRRKSGKHIIEEKDQTVLKQVADKAPGVDPRCFPKLKDIWPQQEMRRATQR